VIQEGQRATAVEPLYLDTNHLSNLARYPHLDECAAVLAVLRRAEARLVVSLYHLIELSNPSFRSRETVQELFESVGYLWALPLDLLWDQEVAAAFNHVVNGTRSYPRAFDRTLRRWHKAQPEVVDAATVSDFLDLLVEDSRRRDGFVELSRRAASQYDSLKRKAAVVRDPLLPILLRIQDCVRHAAPSKTAKEVREISESVLAESGGLAGFPSYEVAQELGLTRLRDARYVTDPNDVPDEWHAAYAPYATVTALDRRTIGRLRSTRLPWIARCTHRLSEVPRILQSANESADE
jgi:hypothetical protein